MQELRPLGHGEPQGVLTEAFRRGRAHHAYLFSGPEGVGKRQVAYAYAALLLCEAPVDELACGACGSCHKVVETLKWFNEQGTFTSKDPLPELAPKHQDLLTLVPHGAFIKIEQIREVLRIVPFRPVEGERRIVIVDQAEKMNPAAANAILKTLEEPPSQTSFILLSSEPSRLLITIRSRCQQLSFGRLSDAELGEILRPHDLSPEQLQALLPLAEGSVSKALELISDPLMETWRDLAAELLQVSRPEQAHQLAAKLAELPEPAQVFMRIQRLLRDALLLRIGATIRPDHAFVLDALRAWAEKRSVGDLIKRIQIVEDTRAAVLTYHTPALLGFERILLEICASAGRGLAKPVFTRQQVL